MFKQLVKNEWNEDKTAARTAYRRIVIGYDLEIFVFPKTQTASVYINDECVSDKDCSSFEDGVKAITTWFKQEIDEMNEIISKLEETTT